LIIEIVKIVKKKQKQTSFGDPKKFLKIKKRPVKTGEDRPV